MKFRRAAVVAVLALLALIASELHQMRTGSSLAEAAVDLVRLAWPFGVREEVAPVPRNAEGGGILDMHREEMERAAQFRPPPAPSASK